MSNESSPNEIHYNEEQLGKITQCSNLDQTIIRITEDKVRIILKEHLEKLQGLKSWITPISIFLSLLLIQTTATTFRKAFGIRSELWEAIFLILTVAIGIWSLISICKACYLFFWKKVSLESIIKETRFSTYLG